MRNPSSLVGASALVLSSAVVVIVAAVGAVAFVAELHQTWTWYFRMEETISTVTPVVMGLVGVVLVTLFGLVLLSPTD